MGSEKRKCEWLPGERENLRTGLARQQHAQQSVGGQFEHRFPG